MKLVELSLCSVLLNAQYNIWQLVGGNTGLAQMYFLSGKYLVFQAPSHSEPCSLDLCFSDYVVTLLQFCLYPGSDPVGHLFATAKDVNKAVESLVQVMTDDEAE